MTGVAVDDARVDTSEVERESQSPSSGVRILLALAVVTAVVVLSLFRQHGGQRSWRRLYAEDGYIYTQQAIRQGSAHVLFRGHYGYATLAPRLVAAFATRFPVATLALVFAVTASVVTALLGWFTYHSTEGWIASRPLRLAVAVLVCLAPAMGFENTANATNLIWAFAAVAPWALISYDERARGVVVRSVVAFIAAASTPLCFVYVPIAIWHVLDRRTRASLIVAGSFVTAACVEVAVMLSTPQKPGWSNSIPDLAKQMGSRVFGVFVFGNRGVDHFWGSNGSAVIAIAVALVCVFLVALFVTAPLRARAMGATFAVLSIATFVVPVWGRGTSYIGFLSGAADAARPVGALRYSVVPVAMLASSLAVLAAPVGGKGTARRSVRVLRALIVADIAITVATGLFVKGGDWGAANWRRQVAAARVTCARLPRDADIGIPQLPIPVSPVVSVVHLRCSDL